MDEQRETPVTPKSMTRRDFLKLAAGGAGSFVLEQITSPIKNAGEFLKYIGLLHEGNPLQRLGTFQELNRRLLLSPSDENRNLLVGWLKLNAAEYYFALNESPLASQFIRHFLYGKGEVVDVSDSFQRAAIEAQEKLEKAGGRNEQWYTNNENPLTRFFERVINTSFYGYGQQGSKILVPEGETFERLKNGEAPKDKFIKIRTYPGYEIDSLGKDIYYSLCRYTLVASGKINGSPVKPEGSGGRLTMDLKPAKATIIDRYDWTSDDSKKVERINVVKGRMGDFIIPFLQRIGVNEPGKTIRDLIGSERALQLWTTEVGFRDTEGFLIESNKYGHPFDITGTIDLPEMQLRIPFQVFDKV